MAEIKYKNVRVSAIAACVPRKIHYNTDEKTVENVGIKEKRIADPGVTASDLCFKAAEKLIADNNIDKNSIDMVLFMSQLPDYRIPATAPLLQHRLGLPTTTAALDLSLGCSGWVYALSTAMAYASMEGINRVLLLDGDTLSKIINPKDKVDEPLYGDAGTATLVEKCEGAGKNYFSLFSDGAGEDAVKVRAGGARYMVTEEALQEHEEADGSILRDTEIYMNGMEVFNFVMRVVSKSMKGMCATANIDINNVGHVVLHQANKFMTDFIAKRIKCSMEKVPYCLDRFGNTSSPSIPLTISSELHDKELSDAIVCGFGAGLSWATAYLSLKDCKVSPVIEY